MNEYDKNRPDVSVGHNDVYVHTHHIAQRYGENVSQYIEAAKTERCEKHLYVQEENVLLPVSSMLSEQFDLVFSVGLIEHFPEQETVKALQFHLDCTKSGGLVIVFFPTPTILYRLIRKLAEITGFWIFHDERPLSCRELLPILSPRGKVLEQGILYAMGLTQAFIVFRKS